MTSVASFLLGWWNQPSHRRPISFGLAAGLMVALISLFLPNYYRSEAYLLPVESRGGSSLGSLGNLASAAAAFGVSVPGGEGNDANFVDVLKSRWLRRQLLQREYTFKVRSWYFGRDHVRTCTLFEYLDERNEDRALRALDKLLGVSRDLKTKTIAISMETKSAELSQQVLQQSLVFLETFVHQRGRTRGGAKAAFTEARLQEARREMGEVEEALRAFLEVNRGYQSSGDPAVRLKGARLEAELRMRQQLVTTLAVTREQALLEEKDDLPILNVLDAPNLPLEKSRPSRGLMVVFAALCAGGGMWAWIHRAAIKVKLFAVEMPVVEP